MILRSTYYHFHCTSARLLPIVLLFGQSYLLRTLPVHCLITAGLARVCHCAIPYTIYLPYNLDGDLSISSRSWLIGSSKHNLNISAGLGINPLALQLSLTSCPVLHAHCTCCLFTDPPIFAGSVALQMEPAVNLQRALTAAVWLSRFGVW